MKHLKRYSEINTLFEGVSNDIKPTINDILSDVIDDDLEYEIEYTTLNPQRIMIDVKRPDVIDDEGYVMYPNKDQFEYRIITNTINHLISYLGENKYKLVKAYNNTPYNGQPNSFLIDLDKIGPEFMISRLTLDFSEIK